MDNQVEEFKQFARKYPGLKYEVRSGKATWQSIFEEWYLYGEEDSQWEKFKEIPKDTVASKETVTADEKSSSDSKSSTSTMSGAEMMTPNCTTNNQLIKINEKGKTLKYSKNGY